MISASEFTQTFRAQLLGTDRNWVYTSRQDSNQAAVLIYTLRLGRHQSVWNIGEQEFKLTHDQILLAPPKVEKKGQGNIDFFVILFPSSVFDLCVEMLDKEYDRQPFIINYGGKDAFFFDTYASNIFNLYQEQPALWALECLSQLIHILARVFAIKYESAISEILDFSPVEISTKARIEELTKYMSEYPEKEYQVIEMARSCYMNRSQFYQNFKRVTGYSPQQYLIRLRIQKARELIEKTDLPITRIAYECGFKSIATFYYNFNQLLSNEPKFYRKNKLK